MRRGFNCEEAVSFLQEVTTSRVAYQLIKSNPYNRNAIDGSKGEGGSKREGKKSGSIGAELPHSFLLRVNIIVEK